ncbi:MAG: hypothetical protein LBI27_05905, partial [Clostridiales bacterium]|nr:hypothetical protein [Clostridiales bacterium]
MKKSITRATRRRTPANKRDKKGGLPFFLASLFILIIAILYACTVDIIFHSYENEEVLPVANE